MPSVDLVVAYPTRAQESSLTIVPSRLSVGGVRSTSVGPVVGEGLALRGPRPVRAQTDVEPVHDAVSLETSWVHLLGLTLRSPRTRGSARQVDRVVLG